MNADNTIKLDVTIERLITTEQLIEVWLAAREHHEKCTNRNCYLPYPPPKCPECLLYLTTTEALTIAARTITIGKAEE
jgi:hypothetical protein